jgi:hypothetical protein
MSRGLWGFGASCKSQTVDFPVLFCASTWVVSVRAGFGWDQRLWKVLRSILEAFRTRESRSIEVCEQVCEQVIVPRLPLRNPKPTKMMFSAGPACNYPVQGGPCRRALPHGPPSGPFSASSYLCTFAKLNPSRPILWIHEQVDSD